jgi:quercetin dioxygenase-like cupin family protein
VQTLKNLRKTKIVICVMAGVLTVFVGAGLALSNVALTLGTVASYDFGVFGPGYPVPGTVQIHVFTMKPGDAVPWHYHKAPSYVILRRGTLTEQHFDPQTGQCVSEKLTAGNAFVEPPGLVHHVTNTGNDEAVIWWSTVFPKSDGIVEFTPAFRVGGVYPVPPPNCNEVD